MKKERILELLQDCIDNIIKINDEPVGILLEEIGFSNKELIELGFDEGLFGE